MQQKNELVEFLNSELEKLGWNKTILARETGLANSVITRMMQSLKRERKNRSNAENLYLVLKAMGFLKKGGAKELEEKERKWYNDKIQMLERHIDRLEMQIDGILTDRRRRPMEDDDKTLLDRKNRV